MHFKCTALEFNITQTSTFGHHTNPVTISFGEMLVVAIFDIEKILAVDKPDISDYKTSMNS